MADPLGTVSWWELDEPSSAVPAASFGPVANPGTYSAGGLTFGGRAGGLGFNGTSGVVTVPDAASLDLAGPWAIWAVVKRGATGAVRTIVSKGDKTYCLQLDATGKPQLRDNGVILCTASAALDTATHTILAGRNGTTASIYVDGVQVATTAAAANTTVPNAWPLRIGADTTAAGAIAAYYNGTIYAAAVMNSDAITSSSVGTVILPALGPAVGGVAWQYGIGIPALLTTFRDPADTTNLTGSLEVLMGHGRIPQAGPYSWSSNTSVAGGQSAALVPDASGHATASIPFLNSWNGRNFDLTLNAGGTAWVSGVVPQWAIARLANVALGDHVTGLLVTPALVPAPANHVGAVLIRAAQGPANSDYAAGSSWTLAAATVQSQLPALAAYLAAQLQLVRTA